jgi:outer membrane protein OmpA-like peptidoglycan-associated protein
MNALLVLLFVFAFAAMPTDAQAQKDWPGPRGGEIPTVEDLFEALAKGGVKTRTRGLAPTDTTKTPGIALIVQFGFDSSKLDASARETLDQLGEAIASNELRLSKFLIEGHTDAVGAASYNLELSRRRAETVRDYLVINLGIERDRLVAVGKGESDLLDPAQPDSPVNRRVEIVNAGPR